MKNRQKVNIGQMSEIIKDLEKETNIPFIGVKMRTELTNVLKKCKEDGTINPYYKGIFKVSNRSYRLVTNYDERVKNNRIKEGKDPNTFVVEPPKGKKHISKSLLTDTETETKTYLMIEWFPEHKSTTTYEFQNNPIEKVMFEKWISDSETSNEKQGLNREVHPITPNLENILEVTINGTTYELK